MSDKTLNHLTLDLFNGVIHKKDSNEQCEINTEYAFVMTPGSAWAEDIILEYYKENRLNQESLNKSFHKSWQTIMESSREELAIHQILHYLSTYGGMFGDYVYIPNEKIEEITSPLPLRIVHSFSETEIIDKCLYLLESGVALEKSTIEKVLNILDHLNYQFDGSENIKNKEAYLLIIDSFNLHPKDPVEFLRYLVYKATNEEQTLLIKDPETIRKIQLNRFNPSQHMKDYGLKNLATIFNRYKPIFLAFKKECPRTINRISKLSKVYHKPFAPNPINVATSFPISDYKALQNATVFTLFKALDACYRRKNGQKNFVYQIRNGKSWAQTEENESDSKICEMNFKVILDYLKNDRLKHLKGKTYYIPDNVKYALPTSEKKFVGSIPVGTAIVNNTLNVGIYWENQWGARDLDLSSLDLGGEKVGWNASFKKENNNVLFSGDMTDARNGAVEYLTFQKNNFKTHLIMNNVYTGENDSAYKIIVGAGLDSFKRNLVMDPQNLIFETKTNAVQRSMVLGMVMPYGAFQKFVVLNFGAGKRHVSGGTQSPYVKALYEQYSDPLTLEWLFDYLGMQDYNLIEDQENTPLDFDFSFEGLQKDSFINIWEN